MQALARTKSIVVMARPLEMQKIEALDAEASVSRFFSAQAELLGSIGVSEHRGKGADEE
jgi:hypothetical protein